MRVRTFTFNVAMAAWIAGEIVGHFLGSTTALIAGVATAVVVVIFINLIDR